MFPLLTRGCSHSLTRGCSHSLTRGCSHSLTRECSGHLVAGKSSQLYNYNPDSVFLTESGHTEIDCRDQQRYELVKERAGKKVVRGTVS